MREVVVIIVAVVLLAGAAILLMSVSLPIEVGTTEGATSVSATDRLTADDITGIDPDAARADEIADLEEVISSLDFELE